MAGSSPAMTKARFVLNIFQCGAIIARGVARGCESVVLAWTFRRWMLAAAAICLPATLLHAALPSETDIPSRVWLTGQLLIASPQLRQPIFDHAVILLAKHSRDGALGIIINRPLDTKPIAGLLAAFGEDASGVTESVRIFIGGPVEPAVGFVLHSADYRRPETLDIDGRVALTGAPDVLRDIGLGKGPSKSLVAFGYAGWGPSQLEDELAHGVWVTVPDDLSLVFDDDRAKVWSDALARYKPAR
jgi:putative transcriptional regulator